jgi:putative sigma-54 modulation protein
MKITVTTRHISNKKVSEKLKAYALEKSKRIERYLRSERDPSELRIILSSEKFRHNAELIINNVNIKAASSVETDDMHTSIDNAVDAIIKQLKKQTDKKITSKRRNTLKPKEVIPGTGGYGDSGATEYENIRAHKLPSKPMSVEEAALQLKVSDANFVAFKNSENGFMNVIYINRRGQVILVEP